MDANLFERVGGAAIGGLLGMLALGLAFVAVVRIWRWLVAGFAEFRDEWGGEPRMPHLAPGVWRRVGRNSGCLARELRQHFRIATGREKASPGRRLESVVTLAIFPIIMLISFPILFSDSDGF